MRLIHLYKTQYISNFRSPFFCANFIRWFYVSTPERNIKYHNFLVFSVCIPILTIFFFVFFPQKIVLYNIFFIILHQYTDNYLNDNHLTSTTLDLKAKIKVIWRVQSFFNCLFFFNLSTFTFLRTFNYLFKLLFNVIFRIFFANKYI